MMAGRLETDPLELALEEGIFRLMRNADTGKSGYRATLAQCVRAFNGAFTDEEIKHVVRRLITAGRLGIRTRVGSSATPPFVEVELWEMRTEAAETPAPA